MRSTCQEIYQFGRSLRKTAHGEAQVIEYYDDPPAPVSVEIPVAPNVATHWGDVEQMNWDQRMVYDAAGPHFFSAHLNPEPVGACSSFPTDGTEAGPSSYSYDVSRLSDRFFDVVRAADQPLYNGCDESQLSAIARLVNIKAENNMSERCYDQDDIGLEYCKFCGDPRYKPTKDWNPQRKKSPYAVLRYLPLIPRLQRLYASPATAKYMTCMSAIRQRRVLCAIHPMLRHGGILINHILISQWSLVMLDWLCARWVCTTRAVWRTYSCWPVILTPYNFPPGMCMKPEYMFLTMAIPGLSNPKRCIDIYLEPLIRCIDARPCDERGVHDTCGLDVDYQ
ncbi:UNVERIFIED_CONTAM: hypothetical protein Sradi_0477400 [Sesamum radiatum]|uniref:Uncharacterized protein n=1 Tax=Sesamum radiatum TaxID=300843 RepID=A0AAW2W7N6_SESRA